MLDIKFILLVLLGTLTGCMGGGPAPQDHYYRLQQSNSTTTQSTSLSYPEIGVPPVTTHGLYRERPVIYVNSDTPLELKQYHYHHWHDAPARLIQQHMVYALQQATTRTRFVRLEPGEQRNVMLHSRVVHFERETRNNTVQVRVELELSLRDNYQVLHKQHYQATIPLAGNTMHATAQAFSEALDNICQSFLPRLND